jgi:hypothetical protein
MRTTRRIDVLLDVVKVSPQSVVIGAFDALG